MKLIHEKYSKINLLDDSFVDEIKWTTDFRTKWKLSLFQGVTLDYLESMGMPFTESDWIFNFQSVSVKFTPLYRGHDFYRKWLNFLCWISASFCKTHLIIWWCMNFTESDWNSGNTVATISASFCKIHALYIRSEFYRKWLKFYSVTRSKLFN